MYFQQSHTQGKRWENWLGRGRGIRQETFTFVLSSSSSLLESVALNTSVCCGGISFGLLRAFLASAPSRSVQWLQSRAAKEASSQRRIFGSPVKISQKQSSNKPHFGAHTTLCWGQLEFPQQCLDSVKQNGLRDRHFNSRTPFLGRKARGDDGLSR